MGWGPEPRFCSFVFSHEIFKPSGAAAVLTLDKQDAASPMDGCGHTPDQLVPSLARKQNG